VGVSFGSERELAFLNAKNGTRIYFPQTNGMLFCFGRDVNINWKHAINALPPNEHDGKGRISIVLWGLCKNVIEEKGSPPLVRNSKNGGRNRRRHGNKENGRHKSRRQQDRRRDDNERRRRYRSRSRSHNRRRFRSRDRSRDRRRR